MRWSQFMTQVTQVGSKTTKNTKTTASDRWRFTRFARNGIQKYLMLTSQRYLQSSMLSG